MRKIYPLLLLAVMAFACKSSKSIYTEKNITEKKLESLIREYSAQPGNTDLANQVKFAYDYLLNQYQSRVNKYVYSGTLDDKENLLHAYTSLQSFYDKVRGYSSVNNLLRPSSVGSEIESTKLALVSGHYEQAVGWLEEENWKLARQAYRSLTKVQSMMPNYKDTRALMQQAKELSMIHAVMLPLRGEGFYYSNTNYGNNSYNNRPVLTEQLVRDLRGSNNATNLYKIYNSWEATNKEDHINWTIDPVWTQLRNENKSPQTSTRTVEKQTEIGKDTAGRPIYKKLTATLTITEVTYSLNGRLEIRINDDDNKSSVASNSWSDSYEIKRRWATYKGDAGALSNADWELVNANRNNNIDQRQMEEKLIEKIYSNLLSYLRNQLNA
ncbi:MAG TPA: hypothetical protein VLC98_10140 [Phnomibacter sp.]|nr:hypothetical protein [Phnomibacter sp.]